MHFHHIFIFIHNKKNAYSIMQFRLKNDKKIRKKIKNCTN